MAQHKTIDRRRAATDAQSVAQRLAAQQQNAAANVDSGDPEVKKQNWGSYYSPREYGSQTEALGARMTAAQKAMQEQTDALEKSRRAMEQLYAQAGQKRQRYYELTGTFVGDTAEQYEQRILDDWTQAVDLYVQGQAEYQKAYDAYRPYEDVYNAAVNAYNEYLAQEQADYAAWRSTVRDAETIRAERAEIGKLRQELTTRMRQANDIAAGTAAPGIQAQAAQNEARIQELQEYLGGIGEREKLLEEELGWSEKLRWEELRQNEDFARESQYQAERFQNKERDYLYNWINTKGGKTPDNAMYDAEGSIGRNRYLTRDEISMYNYLYSTRGAEGAREYLDYLEPELNRRQSGAETEALQAWAVESPLNMVLASGASVLMSPVSGVSSTVGQIAAKLAGEEWDPNAGYNMMSNQKNAIREAVAGQIEESLGETWGPVGSFFYNTGLSMADMLADTLAGNPLGAMALMGSRSFSESVIDAKNRGLNDAQAFAMGATSVLAEVLTEKIGLDEMLHLPEGWEKAGFWKGAIRGAAGEAGEEGLTNLVNLAADISIAGDQSEFAQNVKKYRTAGMDEAQAVNQALGNAGLSFLVDALGGGLSGGVFGGYQGAKGKRAANMQQNAKNAANTAAGGADETGMKPMDPATVDAATDAPVTADHAVKPTAHTTSQEKGGIPEDDSGDVDGMTLEEARRAAINRRNPLISKVLPTVQADEEVRRLEKAETLAQVTGIDLGVDQERIGQADRLGKLLGKEIYFFSENPTENGTKHGSYGLKSNRIGINTKSRNVIATTIGHELTHSVEIADSYDDLRGLVLKRIRQTGEDLDYLRRNVRELYDRNGEKLDEGAVDREIVAKYVEEHLLTDEQSIRQMVHDDRSVARKILGWLDSLWAKISRTERSQERDFVRRARRIYRTALAEADSDRMDQQHRGRLREQMHEAYAEGRDEEADAIFDELHDERPEGLLEDPDYDDDKRRYSLKAGDEYSTQGVHWAIERGVLGKRDIRAAWEAIANAEKRGYYYPETVRGEKFVSSGRYLMVIDTDYRNPTIQTIFEFGEGIADPMDYAKELIIDAAGDEGKLRDAYRAIENLFGEGHVVRHDRESYGSASRENGSGKGRNGGRDSENGYRRKLTSRDSKFSFGGENAADIDREALARAKEMRADGEEMADIFRETGWYVGADGKWRFEIDDSRMKYRRGGDAQFVKDHPEYARFRELERKFIDGAITDEEIMEMAALRSTWSDEARRLAERVARGNAWLADVLEHDALYEQYPRLRRVKVRFGDTDDAGGWWDKGRNEIVLSERYRQADPAFLELKLLHEIQHAIQDIEGFAGGSNPEYWEDIQSGSKPIRENDGRIAKAEREAQEALKGIPPEVAKDFWYAANMRHTDPEGAERLENELFEGEYADAYGDYSWAIWTLQDLLEQDNPKRTAKDLYRSTAGEIEARDAANRRNLDAGIRKNRLPDTGDERTVFVEGSERAYELVGKRADGIEVYETSTETRSLTWKERKNKFLRLMRDQYRGRTAKFTRNGHVYYAAFEYRDVSKNIYGDSKSDPKGKDAKVNVGADGGIFELIENAEYFLSEAERGKTQRMHKGVKYWDYYIKTVQIDGKMYDLLAHIRKKDSGSFVYDIEMYENKKIEPSSPGDSLESGRNRVPNSSKTSIHNHEWNVKQYSIGEPEEGGFTKGWHDDDEAARTARNEGYPVIDGVQVIPARTYVLAQDYKKDKDGNLILDKQGNPVRNHNYGMVAGLGSKPGTLRINFHNKHEVSEETGQTLRQDNVEIAVEDLTPTPGVFQRTNEDFNSLIHQAPEDFGSYDYSEEELAEIEELLNRASMEQDDDRERPVWTAVEPERLTGTVKGHYDRVLRQAVDGLARSLNVPGVAKREYLLPIARELGREYMEKGIVSAEVRDRLFERAWKEGREQEREFYDTYKEVKDYLRTTGLTLGETDRDSRDWGDIRRRAFGTVKLLNQGGLPVDTAWGELREMAPELFPENIYNPADQLQHMIEVGRSIKPREQTLEEYYGPDAEQVRQMERMDFDAAVQKTIADLWKVKRLADERIAEAAPVAGGSGSQLTQEEVTAMYPKLKDARKAVEKAIAKNILTKRDKEQVQRLLRHDIQPEHLDPKQDNVEGILAVYEAKKAFEEIAEPIRAWNRQQKAANYRLAENLLEGVRLKDKKRGFLYSRETMARNIRDIVKDPEAAERIIRTYFKPVQEASAEAIRIQNRYRDRVRALELSRKVKKGDQVSEAYAVQFYGEVSDILKVLQDQENRLKRPNPARLAKRIRDGKTYEEWQAELQKFWEENPGLDKGKIENAAREFGKIYEELFEQMNEVRVRNGYEPINHRSGYFPHFQREGRDGILGLFGKALGIDVEVQQLPTTINGLTHTFKPGIRWFGNALERKGFDTAYDAVEGFDRYITGVSDVICHTDNIQRLRALANQIRYRTSDEGIREQIRKIQERTDITEDEKDTLIRERYESGKFELSNFVVELDEYTNLLANKKSRADRNMEQAMGRDMYNIIKSLESRVAANMVAINPGSWLTNFIPITQGWACLDRGNLIRGMGQTLKAMKSDDGMVDRSAFLTGRKGTDALAKTWAQEWSGKLSSPMEWIDGFTAGTLIRARFQQNLQMGLSEAEAMSEADDWAAGVMADRTKGAMPTVFHRSNPLTKLFTQFQLEVNNQLSYLWKDIPREKRDKGMKTLALALLKFAVGAWLYNEVYEFFFGRRPALDPVDMVGGFVSDWADPELDFADAALGLGGQIAENTPFVGGLIGGGRVPISSALPDAENLIKAVGNSEWSAGKRIGTAAKELAKPLAYMLPPFGGGQIKKVWEGLNMIAQGGSYTLDAKGNPMLQYPLYSTNNDVQKALEAGQAMIFGKTTIRSGRAWVEGGFGNLSAEQTATYQALIAMDVEQADAFELLTQLREAEKTGEQSRTAVQRDILRASGLEGDALATVYYDLMVSDDSKEKTLMEGLMDAGADIGKVAACLMDMKDAADSNAKRSAVMVSGLDDAGKQQLYQLITEDRNDDIDAFRKAGMDMDDFLEAQNVYTDIQNRYEDEGDMATAFARWVNSQSYTKAQKDTVRECFKYWRQMPAQASRYDKAMEAGLDDAEAFELSSELDALTPPEGKDSVQDIQKWRVAVDNAWSDEQQLQMLQAAGMSGKTYDKVSAAWNVGIAPAAWVRAQELRGEFDSDGNGSLTNADWTKLIDSMTTYDTVLPGDRNRFHLTLEQKGFLWQVLTGSKSAKNNPYSAEGGEKYLEDKGK